MTEPPKAASTEERLLALVRREIEADEVTLVAASDDIEERPELLVAQLDDGQKLVARFVQAPEAREALARRLSILVSTFAESLREKPAAAPRASVATSLQEELRAVATRTRAVDAIVIDAHSPVVWGSARGYDHPIEDITAELQDALHLLRVSRAELLELVRAEIDQASPPETSSAPIPANTDEPTRDSAEIEEQARSLTRRAIALIRDLPAVGQLRRGRPLHHNVQRDDLGIVAHSFASIYLLVLVFDGAFDEVGAERSVHDALPRIERLVLALPPHDPSPAPTANVVRMRSRRR